MAEDAKRCVRNKRGCTGPSAKATRQFNRKQRLLAATHRVGMDEEE